jgi:tetratricopeptide (TPR) repeat protein
MNAAQSFVHQWSKRLVELIWLVTIFFIPSYFNLLSSRHFEPDKAISLRAVVTLMATLIIIDALNNLTLPKGEGKPVSMWQRIRTYPLWLAIAIFLGVQFLATLTSVVPAVSFWGSYQRLQGTYTYLSYVVFALILIRTITSVDQVYRFLNMLVLGAVVPTLYGYVQHLELDPLPWKGDVITRVASTMGNSIFIAAYLILVLPIALALGITQFQRAKTAPVEHTQSFRWLASYALALLSMVGLMFAAIQWSGVIRAADLRFWWVYPGAILIAVSIIWPLIWQAHRHTNYTRQLLVPGLAITIYALFVSLLGRTGDGVQIVVPEDGRWGADWLVWLWGATVACWGSALIAYRAKPLAQTSQLLHQSAGGALLVGVFGMLATIFFSQSRGPWIGGGVGLFTWGTLYLIHTMRTNPAWAQQARRWLLIEISGFTAIAVFLVLFNFADIPALRPLKEAPYIGRMGRLFDVSAGTTGDVRMKIWFGDQYGTGAIGLITADPLRTVIGWGPESMFVAYNPFYPPSLANVESRSASPDRSHQALLDELVNKGILGLLSYLAVIGTALWSGLALLRRNVLGEHHAIVIALMSVLVAHNVEGLTGIPIVVTLLVLWACIGLLSSLDTLHRPQQSSVVQPITAHSEPSPVPANPRQRSNTGNRRTVQTTRAPLRQDSAGGLWFGYATLLCVGLAAVWSLNLDNAYADMRFQQGQSYSDSANASGNVDQHVIALTYFIEAARLEPNQDFYYLNMGRSLLSLAEVRRRQNPTAPHTTQEIKLQALIQQPDALAVQSFLATLSAKDITRYAEAALTKAHTINPLNKDHFANMARMYTFWYTRIEAEPRIQTNILTWFADGVRIAPHDVSILNEYIGALISYAQSIRNTDPAAADQALAQAESLLQRSQTLDNRYRDTIIRRADLAQASGDYCTAVTLYSDILQQNPHALDSQITTIIAQLTPQPELLRQLRSAYLANLDSNDTITLSIVGLISSRIQDYDAAIDAFAQLARLQPSSLEAQQNYTLVLSDAQRYAEAAVQSEKLLSLATQSGMSQANLDLYTALRDFFVSRSPGR